MKQGRSTKSIISSLVSGSHPQYKKFAGKHVLVVKGKIFPLKKGTSASKDFERLKKIYKVKPVIAFVPQEGVSYILWF